MIPTPFATFQSARRFPIQIFRTTHTRGPLIMYLRAYLRQLQRAAAEGYPVKGSFQWSLTDNFEWSCGYSKRFGITYVDYKTQRRIPKLSYRWYQQVIRENRVV